MIKKICFIALWGSLSLLAACTQAEMESPEILHAQEDGLYFFEAGFQASEGRTVLEEGGKVKWQVGDEIVLFDATSSARYVALAEGVNTLFLLKDGDQALSSTGTYTAFYPADKFNVSNRTFQVGDEQLAQAGTFDPTAALCMATVTNRECATFQNLCSMLKVNVPQTAIDAQAATLELSAGNSVISGGTLSTDGSIRWNQTSSSIRLKGTFEYDKDYYLAIPSQTFTNGFTMALKDGSNASIKNCARTKKSAVTFGASQMYELGTIYEVVADYSWYEEVLAATPNATEFKVSTPEQFVAFMQMLGDTQSRSISDVSFQGKTVKLDEDLDFTYYSEGMTPIAHFKGSFDGQGHSIKNLKITSDASQVGLFATLEAGQTLQNLTLEGGKIVGQYQGADDAYVGALLGYAKGGSVINCHNVGCLVVGQGPNYVAGLVGGTMSDSDMVIMACSNSAAVTSDSHQTTYVGGIVSRLGNNNRLVACYNVGNIQIEEGASSSYVGGISGYLGDNAYLYGCYNSGSVEGVGACGSLLGFSSTANLFNCCYQYNAQMDMVGSINGQLNDYNVTGCSYAQAVETLNVGIRIYKEMSSLSCKYRFAIGSTPALEEGAVGENQSGIQTPGLGEGEIF